MDISFRQIRSFLMIAKYNNITHASKELNHSQASISKQIQSLENKLLVPLFDRTTRGMDLNVYGKAFLPRAQAAAASFKQVRELAQSTAAHHSSGATHFYHMNISDRWLAAFLSTTEHRNVSEAANELGISIAAVMSSLKKFEDSFEVRLFERLSKRMAPTSFALSLAQYIKLANNEINHARDELSSLQGAKRGRVTVGMLPYASTMILPKSIIRLLERHSYIDISTLEGTYDGLVASLRCGDIDFILGALRGNKDADIYEEPLLEDYLSVVVRKGHPLEKLKKIEWSDLTGYNWILPNRRTPTRNLIEKAMQVSGFARPEHIIETSSYVTLRSLLMESDRVTVLSRHQIHYEEIHTMLNCLPLSLEKTSRKIGMTSRANSMSAPAAEALKQEIHAVVTQLNA